MNRAISASIALQKKLRPKPVRGSQVPGDRGMRKKRGKQLVVKETTRFHLDNVVKVETVAKKEKLCEIGFS